MKYVRFLLLCLCFAAFIKGCSDYLFCRIPTANPDSSTAIPVYQFADKTLERTIRRELKADTFMDIMPYDICFTKHPIKRWDNSGREILDSTNLFIVSHHKGMSYERDSLFPYLVRGVVWSGLYTFFFYDSVTIRRLLKPTKQVYYAHKVKESWDEYTYIMGGLEMELEFFLDKSNMLRLIPRDIVYSNANFHSYFIRNAEFESQNGLIDTTEIPGAREPLFPTVDHSWNPEESEKLLDNFIRQEVHLPTDTITPRIVVVSITIEKDGTISSVSPINTADLENDYWEQEALRIVSKFPPFMPTYIQGQPIRSCKIIEFDFLEICKERIRKCAEGSEKKLNDAM